jgi:hypothetical protein
MSISQVSIQKNRLIGRSSWRQRWFTLWGFHEHVVIDVASREIRNVEVRFWRRKRYRHAFDSIESGDIDVVSSGCFVEPKSGVETQLFGLSFSLYIRRLGWIELCTFNCTRTITPDFWVFFFGWLPCVKRDQIDDGMESAKKMADYLTHHTGAPVAFHGYTTQAVYEKIRS